MSGDNKLRLQVREELRLANAQAGPVLTVGSEADLQALVKLIREMGTNPLLEGQLEGGVGRFSVEVRHGDFNGCACDSAYRDDAHMSSGSGAAKSTANAGVKGIRSALGGLVTLARIQAANIPKGSTIFLDPDAIVTPQVRDWLRQNKVQAQRSEA